MSHRIPVPLSLALCLLPSPAAAAGTPWNVSSDAGGTDIIVAKRSPGDKVLRMWNVSTGAAAGEFAGHEDGIETAAWSPDGQLIATGGWDRTIRVWSTRTGAELHCFTGSDASVGQVL